MQSRNHPKAGMFLALLGALWIANVSLAQDKPATGPVPLATEYSYKNNQRTPIMPPIRQGEPLPKCDDCPTDGEVLRALKPDSSTPGVQRRSQDDVRIVYEKLVDKIDPPRFFPLVGPAQLHHSHWKCTVYFTETTAFVYPFPGQMTKRRVEVVYIDKEHLHPYIGSYGANNQTCLKDATELSEIALLPTDAIGFVSVRVASMMDKLGLNSHLNKALPLKELQEEFGVSPKDVERCTFALFDTKGGEAAIVVRFAEKQSNLKDIHARVKKKFEAVRIIDDRTILLASNEAALKRCGRRAGKTPESEQECANAMKAAQKHDLYVWGQLSALPLCESFPLPGGIECGTVMVDVGDKLDIHVVVNCADEESAAWTKKSIQTGLDMVRAQVLAVTAMLGATDLIPGATNDSDLKKMRFMPLKLLRETEKGIQNAHLDIDGTEVGLSISLPISARMLRSEIAGILRLLGDDSDRGSFELPTFQQTSTDTGTGALVGAPVSNSTPVLVGTAVDTVKNCVIGIPQVAQVVGVSPGALAGGAVGSYMAVGVNQSAPVMPSAEYLPAPRPCSNYCPSTVPAMPVVQTAFVIQQVRLSIANVRKEPAMLFKMMDGGKMEFVQKLPAGEVLDVQTTNTQRWIAVFTDKPAGESYSPTQPESIWLLRSAVPPQPMPQQPTPPAPVRPQPVPPQPGPPPVFYPAPAQPVPSPAYPYYPPQTQPVPQPAYPPVPVQPGSYPTPPKYYPATPTSGSYSTPPVPSTIPTVPSGSYSTPPVPQPTVR